MQYSLHFEHPFILFAALMALIVGLIVRKMFIQRPAYVYPLTHVLFNAHMATHHPYRAILFIIRFMILSVLIFLMGKPQLVDMKTKVRAKGINIMLVLDVSGSMQIQGYDDDDRTRFDVAQQEAIRFIQARPNDAIGLVIFGRDALSRCPLTLDKKMLVSIIQDTKLGVLNPDGTVLARAIVTAANRLKTSKVTNNIMIVLTDGQPDGDIEPAIAINIARQLGIKIYTVGIGSDQGTTLMHPGFGLVMVPGVDKELLESLAGQTGGKFFMARNAQGMREVYKAIDNLEKTEYEAPLYNKYYDIFMPFLYLIFLLLMVEIMFSSTLWFGL